MDSVYLVLIETSGNQSYIFSTNRLRENIGASELTYQAGTYWVGQAVDDQNEQEQFKSCRTPAEFRTALRNQRPLGEQAQKAEIIVAASGKALILAKNEEIAKGIISEVTRRALIEAPGLDIAGVYEAISVTQDFAHEKTLAEAIKKVHKTFERMRSRRPSPESRFLRLPIVASCAVSGLPAATIDTLGRKPKAISQVSATKRDKAKDAQSRLTHLDQRLQVQIDQLLKPEAEDQEEKRSWLAVVHADGNGLGQIFLNFEDYLGQDKSNHNYINNYRKFSLALDECTEAAFKKALDVFPEEESRKKNNVAPIVPLIIGGDDLTVVCDGHYALEFTRVFLQEFEQQTQTKPVISDVAKAGRLSACAGVAIVKRHFPFSVAYDLAEDLIKSAKEVKRKVTKQGDSKTPFPCSAIDFHILFDTSGIDLADIRKKLQPEPRTQLYNRPYVVSEDLSQAEGQNWVELHQWQRLSTRVQALNNGKLPSSQSHALRTALFLNKEAADAQYRLIQQRYDLTPFTESEQSVFHLNQDVYSTSFLDALDAKDFLKNDQTEQNKQQLEVKV
ncbi:Cas10/Cmr2 second palm domain-containing protein [Trichothermofontia sp.]